MQNLKVAWQDTADGFSLKSTGVLVMTEAQEHYPEQLHFLLYYASANAEEGWPKEGAIKHYQIKQVQPGLVEIVLELRYDSPHTLEYSTDRRQLTVHFGERPLSGRIVVLDAGHGGTETGAFNAAIGLREKDINLDVTLRLKELLEGAGANVYLTRTGDSYVPLYARASFANKLPADLFLSIHSNSIDDPSINGVEVFSYPDRDEDRKLARLILEEMVAALDQVPRRSTVEDFAVLRESQIPAVLVELGYVSNAMEAARLATNDFRARAAQAVFRSILRYMRGETAVDGIPGPGLGLK